MRCVVGLAAVFVLVLIGCGPSDVTATTAAAPRGASPAAPASATASASGKGAVNPRCRESVARDHRGNRGISARLCVSDATPAVGQQVTFSVEARDPDARLFGLTGCYPNDLRFGDEEMICEGGPACAFGSGRGEAKEEGLVDVKRTHAYMKPGKYTARLMLQSGSQCPHPYANRLEMTLKVAVQD